MDLASYPLVSIGVPVFNGEKGLERALDSLFAQDYPHLEIVISDNASTDRTAEIAQAYAARDPRVRYVRADANRGANWNFNRVFELSSGTYFLWAAHDDERDPQFVSACVEALERRPDAVLCQVHTAVSIDGYPGVVYHATLDSFERKTSLAARYHETRRRFPATAIYGVYRADAVRRTRLLQKAIATDMAFVQELSIHGCFIQVPRVLFHYCARHRWNTVHDDARNVLGVPRKPWWYLPFVVLFLDHAKRVAGSPVGAGAKLRLWALLVAHEVRHVVLRAVIKVAGVVCPRGARPRLANAIYWRWMHNPNLHVRDRDVFFQRVLLPQLGWTL